MTRKQVTRVFLTGLMMSVSRTPVHNKSLEVIGDLGKGTDKKSGKNQCEKSIKRCEKACDDFSNMLTIMTQASLFVDAEEIAGRWPDRLGDDNE